jgi:predicted 3-demethylubiquinone-9 3-methyltransferase (glyoxalase superfamily)
MTKITPFLWFNDNAEEAANYYVSVFDNATINGRQPGPDGVPMTVGLTIDGQSFTIMNGGPHFSLNEAFSFVIHCQDQAEIDRYWDTLIGDGGEASQCGWLKDKYGVSWQVCPDRLLELASDPDPERAGRAFGAMMTMQKIIIADLEAAADAVPV